MSLSSKWEKFAAEQNLKANLNKKVGQTKEFMVRHKEALRVGKTVAATLSEFIIKKRSPFVLAAGAFDILSTFGTESGHYSYEYFKRANGWFELFERRSNALCKLLAPVLEDYPYSSLAFKYDAGNCKLYDTPVGELTHVINERWVKEQHFYCRAQSEEQKKVIIDWLVAKKIKQFDSLVLTLKDTKTETELISEPINPQPSKRAEKYVAHYKKAFGLGINRSVIFYGPPGTGKTSLAHTIVKDLGLKTLIYKDDTYEGLDLFLFVVEKFGIEAIIYDDFDCAPNTHKLLGVLDQLHRKVPLMIGLVNTMKDFHPAVLRPRRFDEWDKIDAMEPEIVSFSLGETLNAEYFERVKHWPIAYIDELAVRAKLHPVGELDKHYTELNERVIQQLKMLTNEKKEEKKTVDAKVVKEE